MPIPKPSMDGLLVVIDLRFVTKIMRSNPTYFSHFNLLSSPITISEGLTYIVVGFGTGKPITLSSVLIYQILSLI